MNFLKKIDHYLLTNHPVLWRTKVHYFVLFSLILGNVVAFGLGYFPIKWFGAIEMGGLGIGLQVVGIFAILLWLVSQARNKIKYYCFWDEVLTYSIYVLCTASLFGNLSVFERTATHTIANLVSIEQIDIDKEFIRYKYGNFIYDVPNPDTIEYLSYDAALKLAERYQLSTSFTEEDIPFVVSKISDRIDLIYRNQPRPVDGELLGLICNRASLLEVYMFPIFFFLFVPIVLFLLSHIHFRMTLIIAAIYCSVLFVNVILGIFTFGTFPLVLYVLLCAIVVHGKGKLNRFATLLIIPYTLMGSFLLMTLLMDVTGMMYHDEMFALKLSLIFTSIITIFSSAYFIKKYFEPST